MKDWVGNGADVFGGLLLRCYQEKVKRTETQTEGSGRYTIFARGPNCILDHGFRGVRMTRGQTISTAERMSVASAAHTPDAERLLLKGGDPKPSPYLGDVYVGIDGAIAQGQRGGRAGGFSQRHHGP